MADAAVPEPPGAVRVRIPLRWSDMDYQGHVNNVSISELVQEARSLALAGTPVEKLFGTGIVVVTQDVEFLSPFTVDEEPLDVDVWCSAVGAARIRLEYRARHHGADVARARGTVCPFDFEAGRPRRLAPDEHATFEAMSGPASEWASFPNPDVAGLGDVVDVPVRWSDVDRYGHVNNVAQAGYLQEARIRATTSWSTGMRRAGDRLWVVARQDIAYRHQVHPEIGTCPVHTALTRLGHSSVTLSAAIPTDEGTALQAVTVLVCVDPSSGAAVPIDDATRADLADHLVQLP